MARKIKIAAPAETPKPRHRCPECRGAYWWRRGDDVWRCWACTDAPPARTWQADGAVQIHAVP